MREEGKIRVGVSLGDINGVGVEVILKTFKDNRMLDFCTPVLFGSSQLISFYKKKLNLNIQSQGVSSLDKIVDGKINVFNVWKEQVDVKLGESNATGGAYAFKSLEAATKSLADGAVDVLVTAPINKDNIQSEDFDFKGHTEYLESRLEGDSLMILMTDELRVGLVTGHIPVSEIASTITPDLIRKKVEILYRSLKMDFSIDKPKIAVLGINPHCGDHGVIGDEDDKLVVPLMKALQDEGKLVYGPYAADGFFGSGVYKQFDAVLAMYHDQGLAPFKALAFGGGVNFTAGLNKVRTSPDHGTAYAIAGKGQADEGSFKEALFKAIEVYKNRVQNLSLTANALKKVKN